MGRQAASVIYKKGEWIAMMQYRDGFREEKIRPIAICACREGNRILVAEGHDSKKGQTFYRPLGGTIEFGERGSETVRREFREEIGAELTDVRYLGMLENIFTYEGRRGHEIVLVYDGRLAEAAFYKREGFQGNELGHLFKVVWKKLEEFGEGKPPVYPDGLLELLGV
jgi:8-oxo-dGTP pyrophosphatase MutT (NUDIX family)